MEDSTSRGKFYSIQRISLLTDALLESVDCCTLKHSPCSNCHLCSSKTFLRSCSWACEELRTERSVKCTRVVAATAARPILLPSYLGNGVKGENRTSIEEDANSQHIASKDACSLSLHLFPGVVRLPLSRTHDGAGGQKDLRSLIDAHRLATVDVVGRNSLPCCQKVAVYDLKGSSDWNWRSDRMRTPKETSHSRTQH